MRLKTCITIASLCVLFTACGVSCAYSSKTKPKPVKVQVREQAPIVDIGMQPHKEYVVREVIDLQGKQVNVQENVTITFKKGGAIVNGTLKGNGSKLNSKTDEVLGVKLKGTWRVDKISDLVFSKDYLTDTDIINNLNTIQSDVMANEVTINRDYRIAIAKSGGAGLLPSSHSTILLKGTLSLEGNDYKTYQIIDIKNKEDVIVKGGRIMGDVGKHTYIEGTTSEWGMGVNIMQSKDVTISDMYITKCTGDGIYISGGKEPSVGIYDNASKNITIRNVTCDDNRRQGVSIIHVDGLVVRDCSFINTGKTEFTAPGSGIDIEPNVSNGRNMSVRNVVVDNCLIKNNKGSSIATNNTYEMEGRKNYENNLFSNCQTDGLLKAQSHDVTFRKCSFKEVRIASVYAPTHITFENCIISGGYGVILYAPSERGVQSKDRLLALDFRGCTISTVAEETRTNALISCYKSYVPNLEYVNFEDCVFTIPSGKASDYGLTDYSFKGKLRIRKSEINMQGRNLDANGMELYNNKIRCRSTSQLGTRASNRVISDN
ncbi:MAG: right-handed parallel beta-helix repeat-containing protein [Bacteroidales bacterium]|nr:right-handed parallel beta-helix repeat-containing protein [Bacteroidales bacterium]